MFLHDLGRALLRRWYLVLVGLLATVAGVYGVQQYIPVTFTAQASVVLVPPKTAVIEGENPYLYMGALDQAMSVLNVRMNSDGIANEVIKNDPDLSYALAKDHTTTGPIILIEAEGPTEETVLSVVDELLKQVPPNLVQIQDALGVPKNARISSMTIVQDQEPKEINKQQMRMMVAVAGGGLAITGLFTGWTDRVIIKIKQRRAAKKSRKQANGSSARTAKKSKKSDPQILAGPQPNDKVSVRRQTFERESKYALEPSAGRDQHNPGGKDRPVPESLTHDALIDR